MVRFVHAVVSDLEEIVAAEVLGVFLRTPLIALLVSRCCGVRLQLADCNALGAAFLVANQCEKITDMFICFNCNATKRLEPIVTHTQSDVIVHGPPL